MWRVHVKEHKKIRHTLPEADDANRLITLAWCSAQVLRNSKRDEEQREERKESGGDVCTETKKQSKSDLFLRICDLFVVVVQQCQSDLFNSNYCHFRMQSKIRYKLHFLRPKSELSFLNSYDFYSTSF